MQILLPARPVDQPADRDLPEHALKPALVTALHCLVSHPATVQDQLGALLAAGAQREMILKQRAQKLAPVDLQPGLQLGMLK